MSLKHPLDRHYPELTRHDYKWRKAHDYPRPDWAWGIMQAIMFLGTIWLIFHELPAIVRWCILEQWL